MATFSAKEHEEQRAVVEWFNLYKWHFPSGIRPLLFAIPNGGARSPATGAMLKAEGVVAGIPDMFLAIPSCEQHGLFIEMKRRQGGTVSKAQKEAMRNLSMFGYRCVVCRGADEAIKAIQAYLMPIFKEIE